MPVLTCGHVAVARVLGQTENSYWECWPRRSESNPAALSRSPSTSQVLVFPPKPSSKARPTLKTSPNLFDKEICQKFSCPLVPSGAGPLLVSSVPTFLLVPYPQPSWPPLTSWNVSFLLSLGTGPSQQSTPSPVGLRGLSRASHLCCSPPPSLFFAGSCYVCISQSLSPRGVPLPGGSETKERSHRGHEIRPQPKSVEAPSVFCGAYFSGEVSLFHFISLC